MKITFLGTGTSQGVPVIGCDCKVCLSADQRDNRLRTSIMIEVNGTCIVVDTGPDFRQQMLRENVQHLDAVVFTHEHKDHLAGLDDVRAFNYKTKKAIDVYGSKQVHEAIKRDFHYVFHSNKYPGVPELNLFEIREEHFKIKNITLTPIEVWHHMMKVKAFRINDFTYITDANKIENSEMEKIRGSKILVINALRRESHISHFTLQQALTIIKELNPETAYLIHLSHQMGLHEDLLKELPNNIFPAYDGLQISC